LRQLVLYFRSTEGEEESVRILKLGLSLQESTAALRTIATVGEAKLPFCH